MQINPTKLDLKDRKILYELDKDARAPCSIIAKKVGLSKEVVNYRIKKLEEAEIITGYQTIINLSKVGIMQFKICLKIEHINSMQFEKILEKLKQIKEVKWIVSCNGPWDLMISLETDSIFNMEKLKQGARASLSSS